MVVFLIVKKIIKTLVLRHYRYLIFMVLTYYATNLPLKSSIMACERPLTLSFKITFEI